MASVPSASNVDIWVRVRPVKQQSKNVALAPREGQVSFHIPREEASGCGDAFAAPCVAM